MPHKGARKFTYPIPDHWTRHDGKAMPVHPHSKPGVAFRDETQCRADQMDAANWHSYSDGSCWEWADREPRDTDILAYVRGTVEPIAPRLCRGVLEDGTPCALPRGHRGECDAFVAIERLSYDQSGR